MGFAMPPPLRSERWALTPPFHPYLRRSPGTGGSLSVVLSLSPRDWRRLDLPVTLPCGARTFLGRGEADAVVWRRGGTLRRSRALAIPGSRTPGHVQLPHRHQRAVAVQAHDRRGGIPRQRQGMAPGAGGDGRRVAVDGDGDGAAVGVLGAAAQHHLGGLHRHRRAGGTATTTEIG